MVAANSEEEKCKWLEDLTNAIESSKTREDSFHYLSLKSISKLNLNDIFTLTFSVKEQLYLFKILIWCICFS